MLLTAAEIRHYKPILDLAKTAEGEERPDIICITVNAAAFLLWKEILTTYAEKTIKATSPSQRK